MGCGGSELALVSGPQNWDSAYSVAHQVGLDPIKLTIMWHWILLRAAAQGREPPPPSLTTKQRPGRIASGPGRPSQSHDTILCFVLQVIFHEGSPPGGAYFVARGALQIWCKTAKFKTMLSKGEISEPAAGEEKQFDATYGQLMDTIGYGGRKDGREGVRGGSQRRREGGDRGEASARVFRMKR